MLYIYIVHLKYFPDQLTQHKSLLNSIKCFRLFIQFQRVRYLTDNKYIKFNIENIKTL